MASAVSSPRAAATASPAAASVNPTATRLAAPAPTNTLSAAVGEASSARARRSVLAASAPATPAHTQSTNTRAPASNPHSAATGHDAPTCRTTPATAHPVTAGIIARRGASAGRGGRDFHGLTMAAPTLAGKTQQEWLVRSIRLTRGGAGRRLAHGPRDRSPASFPPAPGTAAADQAPAPGQPGPGQADRGPRRCVRQPDRRHGHAIRRVDAVRLPARALVRVLDRLRRRVLSVRAPDDDRLARGDLPVDVRDDQPEPRRREAAGPRRPGVEDRAGGGSAERAAAGSVPSDPRADQGAARARRGSA